MRRWTGRVAGSPSPGARSAEVMNRSSQGRKFPAQELPTSLFTGNAEHQGGACGGRCGRWRNEMTGRMKWEEGAHGGGVKVWTFP